MMLPLPVEHDFVTVMESASSLRMCKLMRADGTSRDYDDVKIFNADTHVVTGLDDLLGLVHHLAPRSRACVVRGELIGGTREIRRLKNTCTQTGEAPTLRDVPRQWLAIDSDCVLRPDDCPAADLERCADLVFDTLPPVFASTACIVVASANHGIKPTIRLRLWFWCSRKISGAELKRWLGTCPVDHSVFSCNQPIYTARPIFEAPRLDPLANRVMALPGYEWLTVPSEAELAPPPRPALVPQAAPITDDQADSYARGALAKAADAIMAAGEGNRHRTITVEASNMARLVHAGLLNSGVVSSVLTRAAEQAGKDDHREIALAIAWGLKNPAAGNLPGARRYG